MPSKKQPTNQSQNSSYMATYLPSHKSSKLDKQNTMDTGGEVRMNPNTTFFYEVIYMDIPMLADQQRIRFISSVWTQDAV